MIAPAVGRIVAGGVAGERDTVLDILDSRRFQEGRTVPRAPGDLSVFMQLLANGLVTGSVYAIAAVGVSLVYGILRLVNFAYGDIMTFGAFAVYFERDPRPADASPRRRSRCSQRPSSRSRSTSCSGGRSAHAVRGFMSLFLASIGVALVLRQAILLVWGPQPRTYDVDPYKVYVIGERPAVAARRSSRSSSRPSRFSCRAVPGPHQRPGRMMRALADDRALAQVSGIDVDRVVLVDLDHLGPRSPVSPGVLAALVQSTFDPNFGFQLLLPVFAAVVLGGIGSAYGALAGGLVLGLATELSTWEGFGGGVDPVYKPVVAFVVLIVALLLRPQGLFGQREDRLSMLDQRRVLGVRRHRGGHLHALHARPAGAVRARGPAQLRPGRVHGDRRLHDGHPRREGRAEACGSPRRLAIAAAALAGVLVGLPTLRLRGDYFAIVDDRLQRDRPLGGDERGPASRAARRGRSTSPGRARRPSTTAPWQSGSSG